ncbi:MAG: SBBP repeat-containing protein, partial [Planctomycetota bacterium]
DGEDGSTVFSTFFGGTHGEWAYGLALGGDGTITIAGSTDSINLETVDPIQAGLTLIECFCDDAFVTQFSPQADAILFSTYLGGTYDDLANEVGVDAAGNIYIAGRTKSADFPTLNATQPNHGGGEFDAFVARIAADHTLSYSTFLGGEDWELVQGVDVDDAGAIYVTGSTRSISFPTTPGAFQEVFVGGILACEVPFGADQNCFDMFVTKLLSDGSYAYSTFIGGHQADEPRNIVVDPAGRAHVIGYTYSYDFPLGVPFGNVVALQLAADGSDLNYAVTHFTPGSNAGSAVAVQGSDLYITTSVGLPYDTYVAKLSSPGPSGDSDADGDVDLDDYAALAVCLLGPGGGLGSGCEAFDMDGDGNVTLSDFALFQVSFTGNGL